jgi:hypothetical protein
MSGDQCSDCYGQEPSFLIHPGSWQEIWQLAPMADQICIEIISFPDYGY